MSLKLYRNFSFAIIITISVGCGSLNNHPNSTTTVNENESKENTVPEVVLDGNEYKIDGNPVKRVDRVCIPVENMNGDHTIRKLEPNVFLYVIDGVFVIGPSNTCKCLPNTTRILTSQGDEQINNIQIGDSVYTFNNIDGKILVPIIQVIKTPVQKEYIMTKITLEDGRSIQASPKHPIPIERKHTNSSGNQFEELLFSNIRKGDLIDNSKVVSIEFVNYNGGFTYDILPAGESGYYWANEVLIGSTLFHNSVSELKN